uniref:BHLH domain-containing protein n=1 Tax=Ananas comosus var. bracteatus TaxID=296719 RepID=A0A6V7PI47_ANACO|nr:unnamed protein product [Ananas comosus var. bracteatus]
MGELAKRKETKELRFFPWMPSVQEREQGVGTACSNLGGNCCSHPSAGYPRDNPVSGSGPAPHNAALSPLGVALPPSGRGVRAAHPIPFLAAAVAETPLLGPSFGWVELLPVQPPSLPVVGQGENGPLYGGAPKWVPGAGTTSASELTELNNGFLNLSTWDQSNFDSALSSLVSSPPLPLPPPPALDNFVIRELIGRLGTICSASGDASPPSPAPAAAAAAAPLPATAPRSAPPEAPPPPAPLRPAATSCFGAARPAAPPQQFGGADTPGRLSRASSSRSLLAAGPDDEDESSSSVPDGAPKPGNARKRKGAQRESNARPPEPPKDYIHVRARRGQATDSHSLAERVRREKISERMKFLQDLVPGCNKVTGKAVMLDEIINYVQSLQRQVEFLSMKLATMNPRLEFNMDNLLPKDVNASRMRNNAAPVYPLEAAPTRTFPFSHQPQGHHHPLQSVVNNGIEMPLSSSLHRSLSMPLPPLDGFADASSQLGTFWEDDLQSVVQMGFGQTKKQLLFPLRACMARCRHLA